ncbi:MAG TPA: hypothetical protein DCG73_00860 [Morganella sp. (in: Bacteria)]|nr:hypothetical protein [Morganella sp. (in: enterobacteria)]
MAVPRSIDKSLENMPRIFLNIQKDNPASRGRENPSTLPTTFLCDKPQIAPCQQRVHITSGSGLF